MPLDGNTASPSAHLEEFWQQPSWYAVHTRPCREHFAAEHVRTLGLEVFLPHIRRQTTGRHRRPPTRPLFPGYLFTRLRPATHLDAVRHTPGVQHIVSACNQPAPVHDEIIAGLKARMNDDGCVPAAQRRLVAGDEVTIGDGPFRGLIARFERECDDGLRVMLLLESISQARVCIDKDSLHPAL